MSSSFILYLINIDKFAHDYIQNHLQNNIGQENLWNSGWNFFLLCITYLGNPNSIIYLAIGIILLLWILKRSMAVICFSGAMLVSATVIYGFKESIQRIRPEGIIGEVGYSFPSGHALISAVFFPLCIYLFKQYIKTIWIRRLVIFLTIILAVLIGFSRIYFGVHYLSDVLGGFLLGGVISAITILIMEAERRKGMDKLS